MQRARRHALPGVVAPSSLWKFCNGLVGAAVARAREPTAFSFGSGEPFRGRVR